MTFAQPFTDYEILDRVGAGAMGTVFKARHKKLNRIVALKVLKPSLARDSRYVDRLRREARIVASLNDPHIVTGYDLGEEGGYHFFVMEFIEGKSLRALLVEWGMFAEEYVIKVGQQVAQALDHAYQRGVIHRDVKPGNILIDEHGLVKLTDMGLAKGPTDMTLTRDGATVGTPQYISPEQARNPQDVDVRTDLYSLGATLYHMATGVPPFRGDTMAELITKVLHETPAPPNEINPALSEGLSLVLRKLLAKDLRVRYQTPRELLSDLDLVQRSLPPEVDSARLSAVEADRHPNLLLRSFLAVAVALVLGGAVWVGTHFPGDPVTMPSADRFLVDLDLALQAQATPGLRLLHLRTVKASAPIGTEVELQRRERRVAAELQQAVDDTAASFLDSGWAELVAWLREPSIWPDRRRVEQERVLPRLAQRSGLLLGQLQESVRLDRIEAVWQAIDRELADRDAELLRRFEGFLLATLPAQVEERLRASDFAGADRLWANALQWFDGVRTPTYERLTAPVAQRVQERRAAEAGRALPTIVAEEGKVADALRDAAAAVFRHLETRLAAGVPPEVVGEALAGLRQQLLLVWPSSARFRMARDVWPSRDPWPEIERQGAVLQSAVAVAIAEADGRRFDRRCDLAWRALCNGLPGDGLQLLASVVPPNEKYAASLALHRQAMQAGAAVQSALVLAIRRAAAPVPAFPRDGGGYVVELRVEEETGELQLWGQAVGQPPRRASISEFRFRDLLGRIEKAGGDPLAGLPRDQAALGVAVLTMVGDEIAGLGTRLQALGLPFLLEDVWPRILRVRNERDEPGLDRAEMFVQLRRALEVARRGGTLRELEKKVQWCTLGVPPDDLSEPERLLLRSARGWLALASRCAESLVEVTGAAPSGAGVEVAVVDDEIQAVVTMPAGLLLGGAKDNWHPRGELLEFSGADRPWRELPLQQLHCDSGIEAVSSRAVLQLDVVLPPAAVGCRLYVVEFRGIAVLLTLGGNDAVHAALLEGDPLREEPAQRAFQQAISASLQPPKALAIPGALHRLTIEVHTPLRGTRAMVRVAFEQHELLARQVFVDPEKPASMTLYPRQEIAVQRVVVRGFGL